MAKNWVTVAGSAELARPLIERAERADGSSPVSDQALLAVAQGQRELLLFASDEAAGEQAGVVAVGILGQGELDLVVDPPARGRGIGTRALRELLARPGAAPGGAGEPAGDQAASQTSTPATGLLAWAHGENPAASALLRGAGFVPVRSLYRMALDPALLPGGGVDPLAVALPAGFALRTFGADRVDGPGGRAGGEGHRPADPHPADAHPTDSDPADARAWVAANAAAFASHPEQGKVTLEDFALMRAEPWFNPADLFLLAAPAPAALAGFTWVKTVREGEHVETELYAIGIVPGFAGQGLGRALLDVTLARMAQHHPSRVTLYVDGENERAVRMYEAAGFTIDSRSTQWRGPQVSE
ncbi:mycothiol synthase [Leucobacter albus]|uniref:Mycothiol synthase n=1 Tax=Leucobacter albus TaxID=272210 RepID=A0ABW3TLC6_9MICO